MHKIKIKSIGIKNKRQLQLHISIFYSNQANKSKTSMRPSFTSHHNLWLGDRFSDCLVWQDVRPIHIDFVIDDNVLARHGDILHAHPLANGALPAHDGRLHPAVRFDQGVGQNGWALDAHAVLNDAVWPDHHVRTDSTVFAYFSCRVLDLKITVGFRWKDWNYSWQDIYYGKPFFLGQRSDNR